MVGAGAHVVNVGRNPPGCTGRGRLHRRDLLARTSASTAGPMPPCPPRSSGAGSRAGRTGYGGDVPAGPTNTAAEPACNERSRRGSSASSRPRPHARRDLCHSLWHKVHCRSRWSKVQRDRMSPLAWWGSGHRRLGHRRDARCVPTKVHTKENVHAEHMASQPPMVTVPPVAFGMLPRWVGRRPAAVASRRVRRGCRGAGWADPGSMVGVGSRTAGSSAGEVRRS